MKIRLSKSTFTSGFANIVILGYWLLMLVNYTAGIPYALYTGLIVLISMVSFLLLFMKNKSHAERMETEKEIFLLVIVTCLGWLSCLYNQNLSYHTYIYMIFSSGSLAMLMKHFKLNSVIMTFLFSIYSMYFIYDYYVHGNFNYVFDAINVSRNYISVFLLALLLLVFLSYNYERKFRYLVYALIAQIFCSMALGRGGILSLFVLNMLLICLVFEKTENNRIKIFIYFIFILFSIVMMQIFTNLDLLTFVLGKFKNAAGFVEAGRAGMISEYVSDFSDVCNFLFGSSIQGRNMHNTYIMYHSRFGILGLGLVLFFSVRAVIITWITDRKILTAVIIAVMLRIFTDAVFSISVFDSILYYIMFTGMDSRKIYFIKGDYVQRTSKKNGTYIR